MTLRASITKAGGVATLTGLARRWDITRQRAAQLATHRDFPDPIPVDGGAGVYFVAEADEFRAAQRRPGPRR